MGQELLSEKYSEELYGVLNCYDRIIISGNVQGWCYAKGMTGYLYSQNIKIFDYAPEFAQPHQKTIGENAESIAKANGLEIDYIRKSKSFRKEARIKKILAKRGEHPGLVHIFSALESCPSYKPWHDKQTGKTYLKNSQGKCLHYYFYFIEADLGLCYLRVPSWAPFRLQFYFNGHNRLARQLEAHQIGYEQQENAFLQIADFDKANALAGTLNIEALQAKLDDLAQKYCPVVNRAGQNYHWSIMQAEYATDLVFKSQDSLQTFYPHLLETLIHAVKPSDIATFLGRKLHGNYQDEMGNRFNVRCLGHCIKHRMGSVSIKMYDKFKIILRLECTVNDVSFFKQYGQVHHRDGSVSKKWAAMKKSIYSLSALQDCLQAANQRYHKFIATIETPELGLEKVQHLAETVSDQHHRYKGFNLLAEEDASLFCLLLRGEFVIAGFSNKDLRQHLSDKNPGQVTRLLKRLRLHRLIKRAGKTYRYYLSETGRQVAIMALKLRNLVIIPALASQL